MTPSWCIPGPAIDQGGGPAPNLLFDGNWTTPVVQAKPATAAALLAAGCGTGLADSIYVFDELAGSLLDKVGSNDLVHGGSLQDSSLIQGQGTADLNAVAGDLCGETIETSIGGYQAANSGVFNFGSASFAILLWVRFNGVSSTYRSIFGKTGGGQVDLLTRNNGALGLRLASGTTQWRYTGTTIQDGAWHPVLCVCDRNAGTMDIHTDVSSAGALGLTVGNLNSTGNFSVGRYTGAYTTPSMQIAYMAVWTGAAAEGMDATDLACWAHGTDPSPTKLDSMVHASMIWDRVDAGRVGGWCDGQVPIGWNPGLSNDNKMGLRCTMYVSTLLNESDDFLTTWTATNVTLSSAVADLNDSPRGFRESFKLTATGNNGYVQHQVVTTASTKYSIGAFVKRHSTQGTDVTGRLVAYDISNGAEIDSIAFTAGEDWGDQGWTTLFFTTPVGCISCGFRIEIDTSGEIICSALATFAAGESFTPIHTKLGTSTVAWTVYQTMGHAPGLYCKNSSGQVEIEFVCDYYDPIGTGYMVWSGGVGNNDKVFHHRGTGGQRPVHRIYNASGVSTVYQSCVTVLDLSIEHKYVSQWLASIPITGGKYARMYVDGNEEVSYSTGPWTANDATNNLVIGGGTNPTRGLIATAKIYDGPSVVAPAPVKFWRTPAECMANGFPMPTDIIVCDVASGNLTSVMLRNTLVPATSPLYRQVYDGDVLGVGFNEGTFDSFDCDDPDAYKITTGAFLWLVPYKPISVTPGNRSLYGNYNGTGGVVSYWSTAMGARCYWRGNLAYATDPRAVVFDTNPHFEALGASVTSNQLLHHYDWGGLYADGTAYSAIGDMSNCEPFSLGSVGTIRAWGAIIPTATLFTGAAAEALWADPTIIDNWWAS